MRVLFRTILYCALLLGLLGYTSYCLYKTPSQVEARLARSLGQYLSTQARIERCEQPFLGALTVGRIEIPAAPPIAERNVLELEGVQVEDAPTRRAFRFRKAPEPEGAPPTVRVSKGVLRMDREVAGSAGSETARWNFSDLLKLDPALDLFAGQHEQVLIDRLEVQIRDLRPPRREQVFRFEARSVELRHSDTEGLLIEADLAEGEHWSSGQLEIAWSRDAGLRFHGGLDDVRAVDRWLPLLRDEDRDLWNDFRPSGTFNLDLEELDIDEDGTASLRATVRHYDTSARLGSTGLELAHLSGPMAVTTSGVAFGKEATGQIATAELIGMSVQVEGSLGSRDGELRFRVAPAPLEGALGSGLLISNGPLGSLLALLRPQGSLTGLLEVGFHRGSRESLAGTIAIQNATFAGAPFVRELKGALTFEQLHGEPGSPQGAGKLVIEETELVGIGTARGEVRFPWTASGVRVELTDLKVDSGDTTAGTGASQDSGCIFASAVWDWDAGLTAVDLRWLGLRLDAAILKARGVSGSFQRKAGSAPGSGVVELGGVTVPAGLFGTEQEAFEFPSGKARLRFDEAQPRRVALASLKLSGETRALRAAGFVAFSGELDLVVFVVQGPAHFAVDRLPEESSPADWKEASQGSYRAFRVTGTIGAPAAREIGALDPVFVRGK